MWISTRVLVTSRCVSGATMIGVTQLNHRALTVDLQERHSSLELVLMVNVHVVSTVSNTQPSGEMISSMRASLQCSVVLRKLST